MSDSLWPRVPQHIRPPCPSLAPRVHPNSCPLSRWCHPTISSSVVPSPPTFSLSKHQGLFKWVSPSMSLYLCLFKQGRLENWLENLGPDDSIGEFYWAFKKEIIHYYTQSFRIQRMMVLLNSKNEFLRPISLNYEANITQIWGQTKAPKNPFIHPYQ